MFLPSSSAFFQGQLDAENGCSIPNEPSLESSYDEKMYFRGFMQQQRKMIKKAEHQNYRAEVFSLSF